MQKIKSALVQVAIANQKCTLTYSVAEGDGQLLPGTIVQVPLGVRQTIGVVLRFDPEIDSREAKFKIKPVTRVLFCDNNSQFFHMANKVADLYHFCLFDIYRAFFSLLERVSILAKRGLKKKLDQSNLGSAGLQKKFFFGVRRTKEQESAIDEIKQFLSKSSICKLLLYGPTGSGKTEIYKQAIKDTVDKKKSVMFLVPAVGLAQALARSLLPFCLHYEIQLIEYHHRAEPGQARALMQALDQALPILIVGVHKPVFLPLSNLGLIIIDEEHDQAYVWPKNPRIDTRLVAQIRAEEEGVPVIFGSATPSISSYFAVQSGQMSLIRLEGRIFNQSVSTQIVNLLEAKKFSGQAARKFFWISDTLEKEIRACLERGQQALLFLGRRGHNFFARCTVCAKVVDCPDCSKAMCVQAKTRGQAFLVCHLCSRGQTIGRSCNGCKAEDSMVLRGVGTKEVEQMLTKLFPSASVVRVDSDCPKAALSQFFQNPETADIVIGTQSIVRGLDLPRVSLVALVWADLDFSATSFDSREVAVQQLLQVSGRNRGLVSGKVLIQTLGRADLYKGLSEEAYWDFCADELVWRDRLSLPPTRSMVRIEFAAKTEGQVRALAQTFEAGLRAAASEGVLVGPANPSLIGKVQKWHFFQILLKGPNFWKLSELAKRVKEAQELTKDQKVSIQII